MKIVHINTFHNKATGTIMMNIHKRLLKDGIESYAIWGRGRDSQNNTEIYMDNKIGVYIHGIYTRLTDKTGFASKISTKKLLQKIDKIKPDIIHLHNIHGYYINIDMLFNYIKKNNIKVVWTLHDCWSFTGHCAYFDMVKCEKWKNECNNCPQLNTYPKSIKDNSKFNYIRKKELFNNLNLTFVTPSQWLASLVKESFLKQYPVKVINNGIDTQIFKPRSSEFREKHNLQGKKIILGVASEWTERKGLNDFVKLSNIVTEDVKIVLVGLNKKQINDMPKNILGITRTNNAVELAQIYSTADIFFNPTYEDNYPTTNLESLSCGTPIFTYKTGGSPECIKDGTSHLTNFEDFSLNYKKYLNEKYEINKDTDYSTDRMINEYLKIYYNLLKKI